MYVNVCVGVYVCAYRLMKSLWIPNVKMLLKSAVYLFNNILNILAKCLEVTFKYSKYPYRYRYTSVVYNSHFMDKTLFKHKEKHKQQTSVHSIITSPHYILSSWKSYSEHIFTNFGIRYSFGLLTPKIKITVKVSQTTSL